MSELEDIVDRAIAYTDTLLRIRPTYLQAAVGGLRKLRDALALKSPDDPSIEKLDAYLEALVRSAPDVAD